MDRGGTAAGDHRDRLDNDIVNMKTHSRTNTTGFDYRKDRMIPKHGSVGAAVKEKGFGNVMGQSNFMHRKIGVFPSKTVH